MWKRLPVHYFLSYLETGGADTSIRPWFWLFWLFAGPTVRNICFQWYIFIATRTLVRTEGLLTQLVFEHSLRIRLKAEVSNEKVEEDNLTVIGSQDGASGDSNPGKRASQSSQASTPVSRDSSSDSNPGKGASQSSQASTPVSRDSSNDSQSTSNDPVKGKDSSTFKSDVKSATKDKEAQNLIGKINNLVTTDLGNIVEGRDFLVIRTFDFFKKVWSWVCRLIIEQVLYIPLQAVLCIIFLYEVLGWRSAYLSYFELKKISLFFLLLSALVGLATMFVLFPVPGYIAKKVRDVQVQRMKMVLSYLNMSYYYCC